MGKGHGGEHRVTDDAAVNFGDEGQHVGRRPQAFHERRFPITAERIPDDGVDCNPLCGSLMPNQRHEPRHHSTDR
jgi:hypothetical protein